MLIIGVWFFETLYGRMLLFSDNDEVLSHNEDNIDGDTSSGQIVIVDADAVVCNLVSVMFDSGKYICNH